jgi:hypothetical protein
MNCVYTKIELIQDYDRYEYIFYDLIQRLHHIIMIKR